MPSDITPAVRLDSDSVVRFLRLLADELEASRTSVVKLELHKWESLGTRQLNIAWAVDKDGNAIP